MNFNKYSIVLLIVLMLILVISNENFVAKFLDVITGRFTALNTSHTQVLNLTITENQSYDWFLSEDCAGINCSLTSIKVSSSIITNNSGYARVYVENRGMKYLILDKILELTTMNLTTSTTTITLNETSLTESNTTETNTSETITNTTEDNKTLYTETIQPETFQFVESCVETCELNETFNESSYDLIFELSSGVVIILDSVTYTWSWYEEEATTTTVFTTTISSTTSSTTASTTTSSITSTTSSTTTTIPLNLTQIDITQMIKISKFRGDTTDLSKVDISSVPNLVLEIPDKGKIEFIEDVDLSGGADLDDFVEISKNLIKIDSDKIRELNKSAILYLYDLPYLFDPVILKDGEPCPNLICSFMSYKNHILKFKVTHFTGYASSPNSNLTIWDDTETSIKRVDDDITFYANYTEFPSGESINGTDVFCNITFNVSGGWTAWTDMTFNSMSLLYEYTRTFSDNGTFFWNASCDGSALGPYEPLNTTDNVTVNENIPPKWVSGSNSTNSTYAGGTVEFSLKWTDNVNLSSYVFSLDNCTNSFQNVTEGTLSGTEDWSNVTQVVNDTIGCTVKWKVYANDTSDNWNVSEEYSFVTTFGWMNVTLLIPSPDECTESDPCSWVQNSTNTVTANVTCLEGRCGYVNGILRYNASSANPDTAINTTEGATPFYVTGVSNINSIPDSINTAYKTTSDSSTSTPDGATVQFTDVDYNKTNVSDDLSMSVSSSNSYLGDTEIYSHMRFTFNLSDYDIDTIKNITYYYEGYYSDNNGLSLANILHKESGSWDTDFSLTQTESNYSMNFTSGFSDLISNGMFEFGVTGSAGYFPEESQGDTVYVYADFVKLVVNFYKNPKVCGNLYKGDTCQLTWTVNATGAIGEIHKIDVNFTSDAEIWNDTDDAVINITGIDTEEPRYWDPSVNSTIAGQGTKFNLRWTDNVGLSDYIFSWNGTNVTKTYNFSDTTNNKAYNGSTSEEPPTSLSPAGEQEFSSYTGIQSSDNIYYETNHSSLHPYQKFNITINEGIDDIYSINVSWEGHTTGTAYLYVYNFTSGSWGSPLASSSGIPDFWLNHSITSGFSDYINSGRMSVLVQDPPDEVFLYVDGNDSARMNWTAVGTEPYLDVSDYPTSYINDANTNGTQGDFTFSDFPSSGTIESVELQVNATCQITFDDITFYIWNGSWQYIDEIMFGGSWGVVRRDITSTLNTIALVNDAKMYVDANDGFEDWNCTIDMARLNVTYTPENPSVATDFIEVKVLSRGWHNDTWQAWSGNPSEGWIDKAKTLPSEVGNVIGWRVYANDTSNNWNASDIYSFVTTGGTLSSNLIGPTCPTPCEWYQYNQYWINASVTCTNGNCGNVHGTVRYNASSANPDTSVSTATGATPFYITQSIVRPVGYSTSGLFQDPTYAYDNEINDTSTYASVVALSGWSEIKYTYSLGSATSAWFFTTSKKDSGYDPGMLQIYNFTDSTWYDWVNVTWTSKNVNRTQISSSSGLINSTGHAILRAYTVETVDGQEIVLYDTYVSYLGNDITCDGMNQGKNCTLRWIVNVTGDYTAYKIGVIFNSSVTEDSHTDNATILIPKGYLEVNLTNPTPNLVHQNTNFTVSATVTCKDGPCGTVNATSRYNKTSANPDTAINTTEGATPFYVFNTSYLGSHVTVDTSTTTPFYPNQRAICRSTNRIHVAWRYNSTVIRYTNSSDGNTWSFIDLFSGSNLATPHISCDGENITVTFRFGTNFIANISTDGGATWDASRRVTPTPSDALVGPTHVVNERRGQRIYVFYRNQSYFLYFINSSDGGATWGPGRYVGGCSDGFSSADRQQSIAVDGNGSNTDRIYGVCGRFSARVHFVNSSDSGVTWSSQQIISVAVSHAGITFNSSKIYVTAYGGNYDIYFIKSTDYGSSWGPLTRIDTIGTGTNRAQLSSVTIDSNGYPYVFWQQDNTTTNNDNIVYRKYNGTHWLPLNSTPNDPGAVYNITTNFLRHQYVNTKYNFNFNRIEFVWRSGTASPYNIMYSYYAIEVLDENPKSCGLMNKGKTCEVAWNVNATGTPGTYHKIDVNFTSSHSQVFNETSDWTFMIGEYTPPKYVEGTNSTSSTQANYPSTFRLQWSDDTGLSGFILSTNNSGTWENETWEVFSGDDWSNKTITLNSTVGTLIQWKFYTNDTSDNWNVSDTYNLTTTQSPPSYSNISVSPPSNTKYAPGKFYQFNVTWDSVSGIDTVIIEHNFNGTLQNETVSTYRTISGNKREYYFNFTDLPVGTYQWREYANDTASQWTVTPQQTYFVVKNITTINLYLNDTDGDKDYSYNKVANLTAVLSPLSSDVDIWANFTGSHSVWTSGPSPLINYTLLDFDAGVYKIRGRYNGNQNYSASEETHYLTLWGWVNVSWESPDDGNYVLGDVITLNCSVLYVNTSNPISNYIVKFYNETATDSSLFGTDLTDSSGYAIYNWNTTGEGEGTYYPKCNITDNSTFYYNVSVAESNTTVTLSPNQAPKIWNLTVRNFYTDEPITETATGVWINITVNASDLDNNLDYVEANFTWPNGTIVYSNLTLIQGKNYTHVWNYSLPYEMPNGTAIINVTAYDTFGSANTTNTTLIILENIEIVLKNTPVNFSSVNPGIETQAVQYQGWPLNISVLGNVPVNISQTGEDMIGKTIPSVNIKVGNITWNQSSTGLFSQLTTTYTLVNSSKKHGDYQYIYYKLNVPIVEPQPYGGNITIKGEQT